MYFNRLTPLWGVNLHSGLDIFLLLIAVKIYIKVQKVRALMRY